MKKALLASLFLACGTLAFSQANNYPNGSTVANFTVTDVDGNVHDLYNYTSQGKHVMVGFFFYNCGPCQSNAPKFSELYDTYGCNEGDLIVIYANTGVDNDNLVAQFGNVFGGPWAHPPAIGSGGGGQLTNTFGIQATPTYCLIRPDNKMHNNDIWPVPSMQTFVNAFPAGSNIQPMPCAQVGIEEMYGTFDLEVYPVPSEGQVQLRLPADMIGSLMAEVVDAMGRIAHGKRFSAGNPVEVLDLSGLANGQYMLTLRADDGKVAVRRIIIAR